SVTALARQDLQKTFQPLQIYFPLGRELKEHRAQLFAQILSAGQNVIQSIFRIFKLLVVRNKSAGFYGEDKIFRRRVAPRFKSFNRGQAIEAIVQFQSVKVADVKIEHL